MEPRPSDVLASVAPIGPELAATPRRDHPAGTATQSPDDGDRPAGLRAASRRTASRRTASRRTVEDGSLITEYGLLAIVAATVAGAVISWASNGAMVTLFNALLRQARALVGA